MVHGVGEAVVSWSVREGPSMVMVAGPAHLFLIVTSPDHRVSSPSRKAELVELCGDTMQPNRPSAPLGFPTKEQSPRAVAATVMAFLLKAEHLLVFNNAVRWFQWLQMLVLACQQS